ncbi:MAG: nucleotidyltransferase [Zhongshania sp.]|nr:nucleotidyltransferase [Zhongshania sp.]
MGIQSHFFKFHNAIKLSKTDDSYSDARKKDDSITDAVKLAFKEKGYEAIECFIQGSFSTDTAIKSLDGDFDIDRGIVIDHEYAPDNPVDPKKVVLEVLEKRGFTNAKIKKPCVTADYKSLNLHIDFPIYKKLGSTYYLAIGKKGSDENNREWAVADPKGLKDWIKMKSHYVGSQDDKLWQFNRIVRYLKRWRDHKFSADVRRKVYSIGLTVMIKQSFTPSFDNDGKPCDLTALKNTVKSILSSGYFQDQSNDQYKVVVKLPVSPYRDVFDGSGVGTGTQLKNKLETLLNKLEQVLEEDDENKQCNTLSGIFGDDFHVSEKKSESSKVRAVYPTAGAAGTSHGA